MKFPYFWRMFETARSANPESEFLIHMRIATHGAINLANVHPYEVDKWTVMAHNGIFSGVPDYKDDRSDTGIFIDEVLPELPEGWLDSPYLVSMVEDWIGWSKVMFLTNDPALEKSVYILNQKKGFETDGMWFSNNYGVLEYTPGVLLFPKKAQIHHQKMGADYSNFVDWKATQPTNSPVTSFTEWLDMEEETMYDSIAHGEMMEGYDFIEAGDDIMKAWNADRVTDDNVSKTYFSLREVRELTEEQGFAYVESVKGFKCYGCFELIDNITGVCLCWDKICRNCEAMAGYCPCLNQDGSNLVDYEEASDELQLAAIMSIDNEKIERSTSRNT